MIDPVLVTRKVNLILKDLALLDHFRAMDLEVYLADPLQEAAAERYLERIIGRMIDINYHLTMELGQPPPTDYYESFLAVGRAGVLPADFARDVASAAGLRNRIAHEYDEIDETEVLAAVQRALKDVPAYLQHVQRFVDEAAP